MSSNRTWAALAVALATILVLCSPAMALTAGAASPDGTRFVVGGENRAIYVYDTETWDIRHRIWVGSRIRTIHFTPDGTRCIVLGDHDTAYIFDAEKWAKVQEQPHLDAFAMARSAPVAVSSAQKDRSWDDRLVKVWSLPDWKTVAEIPLEKGLVPTDMAVAADGKTAYLRTRPVKDPKEKDAERGPEPEEYVEKTLWRDRADGRVSHFIILDLEAKAVAKNVQCFDSPNKFRLYPVPTGCVAVVYGRYCGWLDAETGTYRTQVTGQFAYGSGQDATGNLYVGALRSYLVLSPEGKRLAKNRVSALPGFPEYFRDFAPLGSDRVVGVTDGFRLILIDAAKHTVLKEINCY
jgi:hypothetical protein